MPDKKKSAGQLFFHGKPIIKFQNPSMQGS